MIFEVMVCNLPIKLGSTGRAALFVSKRAAKEFIDRNGLHKVSSVRVLSGNLPRRTKLVVRRVKVQRSTVAFHAVAPAWWLWRFNVASRANLHPGYETSRMMVTWYSWEETLRDCDKKEMAAVHPENCQCDECREGFPEGFDSWSDYHSYTAQEREAAEQISRDEAHDPRNVNWNALPDRWNIPADYQSDETDSEEEEDEEED